MIVIKELFQSSDPELLIDQHRNPIADRKQAVQVMGHHKNGKTEAAPSLPDQFVKGAGGDRIEPRSRLVEKHDFRIER